MGDVGTVWRNLKLQKGTESEAENRAEEDSVEKEEMTNQIDPIGGQKEADTEKADTEEEGQGDSGEPVQEQKNQLAGELHATQTPEAISIPAGNRDALYQKNQSFPRTQEKTSVRRSVPGKSSGNVSVQHIRYAVLLMRMGMCTP